MQPAVVAGPVRTRACAAAAVAVALGVLLAAVPAVPATDPNRVLWLRLNEASGTVADDASTYSNDAAVVCGGSGPQWVAGHQGNASKLSGEASSLGRWLSVPWRSSMGGATQLTVMTWARIDVMTTYQMLFSRNVSSNYLIMYLYLGRTLYLLVPKGSSYQTYAATLPGSGMAVGAWHHLAGTYDGAQLKLYYDGVLIGTGAGSGAINWTNNTEPLIIGAYKVGSPYYYGLQGALDDAQMWTRALTLAEIQQQMNAAGTTFARLQWKENF